MIAVGLLSIVAGLVMLRSAFLPNPDPREYLAAIFTGGIRGAASSLGAGTVTGGPGQGYLPGPVVGGEGQGYLPAPQRGTVNPRVS